MPKAEHRASTSTGIWYRNPWWLIINWTIRDKLQGTLNPNMNIFAVEKSLLISQCAKSWAPCFHFHWYMISEPMVTDYQLDHSGQTSGNFESKYEYFRSWKEFVNLSMCQKLSTVLPLPLVYDIGTHGDWLSIGPFGTNFRELWIQIWIFSQLKRVC